jgi:hypothetical protein
MFVKRINALMTIKKLRNKVSMLVKEAKKKYIDEIINNGNDTASLWRAMNAVTNKSQMKGKQSTNHSPQDFNQYYANVADTILNKQYTNQLNYVVPPELQLFCETNRRGDPLTIPPWQCTRLVLILINLKINVPWVLTIFPFTF